MLDHISLGVSDINRSRRFYDVTLRPLGLVRIVDFGEGRGSDYGAAPGPLGVEFTITREAELRTPIPGAHLCFRAPDRAAVDAFHRAALVTGGRDDGAPPSCWIPMVIASRQSATLRKLRQFLLPGRNWSASQRHRTTSSTCASRLGGIVTPSDFAIV